MPKLNAIATVDGGRSFTAKLHAMDLLSTWRRCSGDYSTLVPAIARQLRVQFRLVLKAKRHECIAMQHAPPPPGIASGSHAMQSTVHVFGSPVPYHRLHAEMTLAGLEPAIFGSEDQRLIH